MEAKLDLGKKLTLSAEEASELSGIGVNTNYLLKAWMIFQAAGPPNVLTVREPEGNRPGDYEVDTEKKEGHLGMVP